MFGCDSFDMARIVASNLRRNSGDSAISGRTSLTVTARPTAGVLGVGDQRARAGRHHPLDPVAIAEHTPGEAAPRPLRGSLGAHARQAGTALIVVFIGAAEGYRWDPARLRHARIAARSAPAARHHGAVATPSDELVVPEDRAPVVAPGADASGAARRGGAASTRSCSPPAWSSPSASC